MGQHYGPLIKSEEWGGLPKGSEDLG